jgi:hypothetical protein
MTRIIRIMLAAMFVLLPLMMAGCEWGEEEHHHHGDWDRDNGYHHSEGRQERHEEHEEHEHD